jgi:RNA polymerase sigma factor (sigma-70 family)
VDVDPEDIDRALGGDRRAMTALVKALRPVIQAAVGSALLKVMIGERRDPRQEVRDMVQDVFASLLAHDGRTLRAWDPGRGGSLPTFVGLVAHRHVAGMLRSKRRNPYTEPPASDVIELHSTEGTGIEPWMESREQLDHIYEGLEQQLGDRGLLLFEMLYVQERSVEEVMATTGMTRDAIYAWRSRVKKKVLELQRKIAGNGASDPPRSQRIASDRAHEDQP